MEPPRDHGGGVDAAIARHGGTRAGWIDLSTGINPQPYPLPDLPAAAWQHLPDRAARDALTDAARAFWPVPDGAMVLAVPGLSSIIPVLPTLAAPGHVTIPGPTYNEYAPAFADAGWAATDDDTPAQASVIVHPNNPTGAFRDAPPRGQRLRVIDESFCDLTPDRSLLAEAAQPGTLVLKGLGKFWGLAGLRLGFAIGDPALIAALERALGQWPVSGPALAIGTQALRDTAWADATRTRLAADTRRLDALLTGAGCDIAGGTDLFRLATTADAAALQHRLADAHIWTRIFPWSPRHIRFGLPPADGWDRLQAALRG